MDIKKLLGKKIKQLRMQKGYSQEYFAELINISQRTLSGIECGNNFLTSQTLNKIIEILEISPDELFYIEYLKDKEELFNELIQTIISIKDDEEKLQLIYKLLKVVINN